MADVTTDDVMKAYAEDAVASAARRQLVLDYSEQSLERVDLLLGLAPYVGKTPRTPVSAEDEETLWTLAKTMGAYVGEVAIRELGGCWLAEELPSGGTRVLLDVQAVHAFPLEKVWKRLTESEFDSLAGYCRVLRVILARRVE